MIVPPEVQEIQARWGEAVVRAGEDLRVVEEILDMYGFEDRSVLFKPTRAVETPFRTTRADARSYFLGEDPAHPEDMGFVREPWVSVEFQNAAMIREVGRAIVMGHYVMTNAKGQEFKIEYTFGYYRNKEGKLKIDLHHSSIPFSAN